MSEERGESLKASLLASTAFVSAYFAVTAINWAYLSRQFPILAPAPLIWGTIVAAISGGLFGITYRYIIRDDQNSHLKDGAVLAFGLVRGLAPVGMEPIANHSLWLLTVLAGESIFCFLMARYCLDWALKKRWLQPF